jgi:hypothetical protein
LIVLCIYLLPNICVAQTIAEQQKKKVDELLAQMNQSAKKVADDVISNPQNALDAGCLSGIQGIDLSVFSVDFTNIWGALYKNLKDSILNGACSAATDWVNNQTAALETQLQLPFGLGGITVTQGTAISEWQSKTSTDVQMTNAELNSKVTTGTLGKVTPPANVSGTPKKASTNQDTPIHNKKSWEDKIKDALDVQTLFKDNN